MKTLIFLVFLAQLLFSSFASKPKCHNNTDIRYSLKQPSNVINYFSTCSEFARRTCCAPKNFQAITKKVKKAVESVDMSVPCRERITKAICSICDGDWGQRKYEGVCSAYCSSLYTVCKNDYFVIDSATQKIRACRQQDIFCWKLFQIIDHENGNESDIIERGNKFCNLLDLTMPETNTNSDCWNGEISAQIKGRAKKIVDFLKNKNKGKKTSILDGIDMKYVGYAGIVVVLGSIAYKMYKSRSSPPKYYSLR